MTNTKMLDEIIEQSGLKRGWIAEQLGISRQGLQTKLKNEAEFKASEVKKMTEILSLTNEQRDVIFLS